MGDEVIAPARPPTVTVQRATIGGAIYVPPEFAAEAARVATVLAKPNPEYASWERRCRAAGKTVGHAPPAKYVSAGPIWEGPHAGGYWMPRHSPIKVREVVDGTTYPPAEPARLSVTLRPFQRAAIEAWAWERSGVIVAPCGAGKTTIGAAAIAELATPALVLVHTLDLARQWQDRCRDQLGVEAGLIGAGEVDVDGRRVVVATIQTLASWTWTQRAELGARFGLVILDEAHHCPARTFAEVLAAIPSRYRLGLTATPKRQDGLEDILWWTFGPAVYEIGQAELEAAGWTMRPTVTWVHTGFKPRTAVDEWVKLVAEIGADPERNALVVAEVVRRAEEGRCILVLADRVDHCVELAELITERGERAEALTGRMTKNARANRLAEFRDGSLSIVTATSLADEGLDVARIDTVVLVSPSRNEGRVQQRVGRALRPGSRTPEVVDLVDDFGAALGAARARRALYTRMGWSPPPINPRR